MCVCVCVCGLYSYTHDRRLYVRRLSSYSKGHTYVFPNGNISSEKCWLALTALIDLTNHFVESHSCARKQTSSFQVKLVTVVAYNIDWILSIPKAGPECRHTIPMPSVQRVFTDVRHVTTATPRIMTPRYVHWLCTTCTIATELQRPHRRSYRSCKHTRGRDGK